MSINRLAIATGLMALSAHAFATSQVTLYGRIDTAISSTKTGSQRIQGLENSGSHWGLEGSEDLGHGLSAGFVLESGFNADTGSSTEPSHFFSERSELYLDSAWGKLRLGRFENPSYNVIADRTSFHNEDTGISADKLYVYQGSEDNRIAYASPEWAGLSWSAAVSLHERQPDAEPHKNYYDLAANYDRGNWSLGAGYGQQSQNKQYAVRASWTQNAWTMAGYHQHAHEDGQHINVSRVAVAYAVGNAEVHANLGRATGAGSTAANQWTLGYNYHLSQRTKLYAFYTKLQNKHGASFGNDLELSANEGMQSLAVGIRHNF